MIGRTNAVTGGGGIEPLDYTVTFMAEGEPFEIVTVKSGQSVSEPNIPPVPQSGVLLNWKIGTDIVAFPYTPAADTTIVANITQTRDTMTVNSAGTLLLTISGTPYTKLNNGLAVCGFAYISSNQTDAFYLISDISSAAVQANSGAQLGNVTYNQKTYYVWYKSANHYNVSPPSVDFWTGDHGVFWNAGATATHNENVTRILNHYYCLD